MTGYELRLWRKGHNYWVQERAAEELGVSLRSYKAYEKSSEVSRMVELATRALSLIELYPDIERNPSKAPQLLKPLI